MSKKNGFADPSRLKPLDSNHKQMLRVVIETSKGSRNKFAFDPDERILELRKVLPAGMTFPYGFGFDRSTKVDQDDEFFVNYQKLPGGAHKVLGVKGPDQAHKLVKSGMR